MRKSLVTGGAGFIGSHIVDALVERGDQILVLDDFTTGCDDNLAGSLEKAGDRIQIVRADICSAEAAEAVADYKPEIIFHHAAQINVRRSVAEPAFDAEKNVVGTVAMLEAARNAGTKNFVFASTGGAIYGEQDSFPADESHRTNPECQYGVAKRCCELYMELYSRMYSMRNIALRYANVYGPRQNPKGEAGVVAIFTERLFKGEALRVNGDGKQTRDFVFVGDVVAGNMAVGDSEAAPGFYVYNIGRGIEVSVLEIVDALKPLWESEGPEGAAPMVVEHGPALPGEQRRSVITAGKLEKEFNWSAGVDLKQGLALTISSFVKN